jgi:hypothetical protein
MTNESESWDYVVPGTTNQLGLSSRDMGVRGIADCVGEDI